MSIRPIAIYLPQYHPIPENDKWWGKGFTEWVNVTKAKPLFEGHYQPHLPADLGFYDLRLSEVREAQAALAKEFGLYGFCYYHYWFNGKKILDRPFREVFESAKPEFPFMLCWANENWTRTWDGMDKEVLLHQNHSPEDDAAHINDLISYFKDDRYIKIEGKPVYVIYKPFLMPDATATANRWRAIAKKHGIDLYLCHMVFGYRHDKKVLNGFDAAIDFEPFGIRRINEGNDKINFITKVDFWTRKLFGISIIKPPKEKKIEGIKYADYYRGLVSLSSINEKLYPSIVPGWDNSARKAKSPTLILKNTTPQVFETALAEMVTDFKPFSKEENLFFINAWNEWAEGNHLEPDQKWGKAFLEVVQRVFSQAKV